jgi:hypothetical protein
MGDCCYSILGTTSFLSGVALHYRYLLLNHIPGGRFAPHFNICWHLQITNSWPFLSESFVVIVWKVLTVTGLE